MIPNFPEFKKVEISDRDDVLAITSKYPPYSDFNFQSMWAWSTGGSASISLHSGNLVLSTEGYLSGMPILTLLGDNRVNEACDDLIASINDDHTTGKALCLVPEVTALALSPADFTIEHDDDNSDYVFDLKDIADLRGAKFEDKRRKARMLVKAHPDARALVMDLLDPVTKDLLLEVNEAWSTGRYADQGYRHLPKEEAALHRFLDSRFADSLCVGVFSKGHLLGYSVFSLLPNGYCICHFTKGRVDSPGVYEFLLSQSAAIMVRMGSSLLNYQEDLGLPGLRFFKRSFNPTDMLVKYTVRRITR